MSKSSLLFPVCLKPKSTHSISRGTLPVLPKVWELSAHAQRHYVLATLFKAREHSAYAQRCSSCFAQSPRALCTCPEASFPALSKAWEYYEYDQRQDSPGFCNCKGQFTEGTCSGWGHCHRESKIGKLPRKVYIWPLCSSNRHGDISLCPCCFPSLLAQMNTEREPSSIKGGFFALPTHRFPLYILPRGRLQGASSEDTCSRCGHSHRSTLDFPSAGILGWQIFALPWAHIIKE